MGKQLGFCYFFFILIYGKLPFFLFFEFLNFQVFLGIVAILLKNAVVFNRLFEKITEKI